MSREQKFNVLVSRDGGVTDRHVQWLQDAVRMAYVGDGAPTQLSCERRSEDTICLLGPYTDEVRDAVLEFVLSAHRAERDLMTEGEPPAWRLTCEFPALERLVSIRCGADQ